MRVKHQVTLEIGGAHIVTADNMSSQHVDRVLLEQILYIRCQRLQLQWSDQQLSVACESFRQWNYGQGVLNGL